MSVFFMKRGGPMSKDSLSWLFEEDGTWEVPITGNYEIEYHGGGGGGYYRYIRGGTINGTTIPESVQCCNGGGSGEIGIFALNAKTQYTITIGIGGTNGIGAATSGSTTSITDENGTILCSIAGGGAGKMNTGGTASGSLATAGEIGNTLQSTYDTAAIGEGNSTDTAQTYGDGGKYNVINPQPGAVIITFLEAISGSNDKFGEVDSPSIDLEGGSDVVITPVTPSVPGDSVTS